MYPLRMNRIGRGWALTKVTWAVLRSDRSLVLFPLTTGVCALAVATVFFGAGAGVGVAVNSVWAAVPFIVVGLYLLIAIGQFCAVALAACVTSALDGGETTFSDGITAARGRLSIILRWAAVQLVVGALIAVLQALLREGVGNLASQIVGGLANMAWTVATFFVVPVIALEGLGPREAIKRSTSVIRERWGEGVVGSGTIGGVIFFLGILPGIALVALGISLTGGSAVGGGVMVALGVIVVVVAVLLQATLTAIFRVALYRFAIGGEFSGRFSQEQLQGAFRPKRGRLG
jgi:hypothetical protein